MNKTYKVVLTYEVSVTTDSPLRAIQRAQEDKTRWELSNVSARPVEKGDPRDAPK